MTVGRHDKNLLLPLFEIALVLVLLNHVASFIVNADHSIIASGCETWRSPVGLRFQVIGLGVDEAELRKHPEKATSEESVES